MDEQLVLPDRFWAKVQKTESCWLWTASLNTSGYGLFRNRQKLRPTEVSHRLSYLALVGSIPDDLTLDHLCRNRRCVNPDHLEPVTLEENLKRGVSPSALNARRGNCVNGHEFSPENTRYDQYKTRKNPRRACRTCNRERSKQWRKARGAA